MFCWRMYTRAWVAPSHFMSFALARRCGLIALSATRRSSTHRTGKNIFGNRVPPPTPGIDTSNESSTSLFGPQETSAASSNNNGQEEGPIVPRVEQILVDNLVQQPTPETVTSDESSGSSTGPQDETSIAPSNSSGREEGPSTLRSVDDIPENRVRRLTPDTVISNESRSSLSGPLNVTNSGPSSLNARKDWKRKEFRESLLIVARYCD